MTSPQSGIFALGTASHAYLELDAAGAADALVAAVCSLREPRTTMGGVNLVAGFRPELWRRLAPEDVPADVAGFDADIVGADGYVMPATQHDAVLWLSGSAYDIVFDVARNAIAELRGVATVAEETSSWPYQHDRDLTGFIDGSENPTLVDAPSTVLVPEGEPGAGGTILLLQKWEHEAADVGVAAGRPSRRPSSAGRSSTASSSIPGRRTRTSRAPTRTTSATSSGATCRTGR